MSERSQFQQCLRPLVLWIRFLGIDLSDAEGSFPKKRRWITMLYAAIFLLANIASQCDVIIYLFNNLSNFGVNKTSQSKTITSLLNTLIDFINFAIHGVGSHLILLAVIRPRWKNLMQSFILLEKQLDFEYFIKLRRVTIFSVFFILFWVSI